MALNFDPKDGNFQKLIDQLAKQSQDSTELKHSKRQDTDFEDGKAQNVGPNKIQEQPRLDAQDKYKPQEPHPNNQKQFTENIETKLSLTQYLVSVLVAFTLAVPLTFIIILGLILIVDIHIPVYGVFSLWLILAMLFYCFCVSSLRKVNRRNTINLLKNLKARQGAEYGQQTSNMPPHRPVQTIRPTNSFLLDQSLRRGMATQPSLVIWIGLAILLIGLLIIGAPIVVVVLGMFLSSYMIVRAFIFLLIFLTLPILLAAVVRYVNKRKR